MRLVELERAVLDHKGSFLCERLHQSTETRVVEFRHHVTPPQPDNDIPGLPGFDDFYETFGSITFYLDEQSGDAAVYVASPDEWQEFHADFSSWIDDMDEDECAEVLPDWIDTALVIGEEPQTGNYLLVPVEGDEAGRVFLFDHDGFEFSALAPDLIQYVEKLLDPDDRALLMMASHMRFSEGDRTVQWWIRELKDSRGNVARTNE